MTNAEVSDKLMNDFNSANWEGWKSSVADDAKFNDVATGQKPEGADECTAYAQTWKTIYPDMKGVQSWIHQTFIKIRINIRCAFNHAM